MRLDLTIEGPDAAPQALPMRELAELLKQLDRALAAQAKAHNAALDEQSIHPRLLSLQGGSIAALIELSEAYPPEALTTMQQVLESPQSEGRDDRLYLAEGTREALREMQKRLAHRQWRATIRATSHPWSIQLDEHTVIPEPPITREYITLYGVLIGVGGDDPPRATLRLPNGQRLAVNLTRRQQRGIAMAQMLAQRLYKMVGVRGEARIRLTDHAILYMRVDDIVPYNPSQDAESLLKKLRQLGKGLPAPSRVEDFYAELTV